MIWVNSRRENDVLGLRATNDQSPPSRPMPEPLHTAEWGRQRTDILVRRLKIAVHPTACPAFDSCLPAG